MNKNNKIFLLTAKSFSKQKCFFNDYLYVIIFIIFIIPINSQSNSISEINLVIIGNGTQKILSDEYYLAPSEILINGEPYNDNIAKIINILGNDGNNITIKFNKKIETCENMFNGLSNIKEIDLSGFDASNVKNLDF